MCNENFTGAACEYMVKTNKENITSKSPCVSNTGARYFIFKVIHYLDFVYFSRINLILVLIHVFTFKSFFLILLIIMITECVNYTMGHAKIKTIVIQMINVLSAAPMEIG